MLRSQRTLEKSLYRLFNSKNDVNLFNSVVQNFPDYVPMICALDQYYPFVHLLLSYGESHFDLALYLLCYLTSITDDTSEDFGHLELNFDRNSTPYFIYVWLKKYWLSRSMGHALFASSLDSIDFLSTINSSSSERFSLEKDNFLHEIRTFHPTKIQQRYSPMEYLSKTIFLLGELQSLVLGQTKETVVNLIEYVQHVSHASLIHVLLWLIANYQIADENERVWIGDVIHKMSNDRLFVEFSTIFFSFRLEPNADANSTIFNLHDALKRQLWSTLIDNPLAPYISLIEPSSSSSSLVRHLSAHVYPTSMSIIQKLFEIFQQNDFLDSEQSRMLYICSKLVPMDLSIIALLIETNASNEIHEMSRALFFLFGQILFRRRSFTRLLFEQVFPSLFNMKSNEFMLEPHVYSMCLMMNVLLTLELHPNNDLFPLKSWMEIYSSNRTENSVRIRYEDSTVINAYEQFLHYASEELFSTETVKPVNYFLNWFQTILWMFSRTVKTLKPFVKPKLVKRIFFSFFTLKILFVSSSGCSIIRVFTVAISH